MGLRLSWRWGLGFSFYTLVTSVVAYEKQRMAVKSEELKFHNESMTNKDINCCTRVGPMVLECSYDLR